MNSAKIRLELKLKAITRKKKLRGTRRDVVIYDTLEDAGFGPKPRKPLGSRE